MKTMKQQLKEKVSTDCSKCEERSGGAYSKINKMKMSTEQVLPVSASTGGAGSSSSSASSLVRHVLPPPPPPPHPAYNDKHEHTST